jgi:hypothetical protein
MCPRRRRPSPARAADSPAAGSARPRSQLLTAASPAASAAVAPTTDRVPPLRRLASCRGGCLCRQSRASPHWSAALAAREKNVGTFSGKMLVQPFLKKCLCKFFPEKYWIYLFLKKCCINFFREILVQHFQKMLTTFFKNVGNIFSVGHRQMGELGKKVEKKKIRLRWALVGWKFQFLFIFHEIDRSSRPMIRKPTECMMLLNVKS